MKKCIFYLSYKLDEHGMGARMLRPRKMIQAFIDIGYEVFVIEGFSSTRKVQIKELKNKGYKDKDISVILSTLFNLNKNKVYKRSLEL